MMDLESSASKVRVRVVSVLLTGMVESKPVRHTFTVERNKDMYVQLWDKLIKIYGAELRNYCSYIIRK
jgi:hypothetical protein